MSDTIVRMDFDEWVSKFKPVVFDDIAVGVEKYILDDEDLLLETPGYLVWSFVDGDGVEGIVEGIESHALGYLITEMAAEPDTSYSIDYYIDGGDWDDYPTEEE